LTTTRVVGIAAVGILAYDVVWPVVYGASPGLRPVLDVALTVVAFVIPFAFGVVLARSEPPRRAMVLAAVVGVVDSSLGWAISRWMGPGRTEIGDGAGGVVQVMLTIVAVVAIYGVFGLAGAATGRRWMGHRSVHAGQ